MAAERDSDEQRAHQPGVDLRAWAEHLPEGRVISPSTAAYSGIAASSSDAALRISATNSVLPLPAASVPATNAAATRSGSVARSPGSTAAAARGPGSAAMSSRSLPAEVPHDQAVGDPGPARDLPDGRAGVAALGEYRPCGLEDRCPRRLRVALVPLARKRGSSAGVGHKR